MNDDDLTRILGDLQVRVRELELEVKVYRLFTLVAIILAGGWIWSRLF